MSSPNMLNLAQEIRKSFFNFIKRFPRFLDAACITIAILFNLALLSSLNLLGSELVPPLMVSLLFMFLATGRRINLEKVAKEMLREGDVIAYVMGGEEVQFGFVNKAALPFEEKSRLGLDPEREYITVAGKDGEIRVLPVRNVAQMK